MHLADLTSYGLIRLLSRSAALARSPTFFIFSAEYQPACRRSPLF